MSAHPPVTLSRVEAWLAGEGLVFDHDEDGGLAVDFANCRFRLLTRSGGTVLLARGAWLGACTQEQVAELNDLADQHHRRSYGPRMSLRVVDDSDRVVVTTQMVCFAEQGLSDAQLADFMDLVLRMSMSFFAELEERYPALVTWEED